MKDISELWCFSKSKKDLFSQLRGHNRDVYIQNRSSFKFLVSSFGYSLSLSEQLERINSLAWLDFPGKVDLSHPDVEFVYYEEYKEQSKSTDQPLNYYFGVHIASGSGNEIWNQYDLKKRNYLGTTSMDAELSLITANQALARPGSIIYDPFVGTGSFLISCSHFGAFSIGSDIDGRKIKGSVDDGGIEGNLSQYKMEAMVLGTIASDFAHHPWRKAPFFDAIVCDVGCIF